MYEKTKKQSDLLAVHLMMQCSVRCDKYGNFDLRPAVKISVNRKHSINQVVERLILER